MATIVASFMFSTFAGILAPFRRSQPAPALKQPAAPAIMDAETYAAMLAEAERIAQPYCQHIESLRLPADESHEHDFADVEALLERAGLLAS